MKQLFVTMGVLLGGLWLFSACSGDEGSVGEELLGTNQINVSHTEDADITVSNTADMTSDLSSISTALLGTLNDNIFGKTRSSAAFQVRLPGAIKLNNPIIDSAKLFMAYENHYGADSTKLQTARVYLLKDDIQHKKVYNAATEIAAVLGEEVGTVAFNKNLVSDTIFLKSKIDSSKDSTINSKKQVDTILRHLAVNLDKDKVGQFILNGSKEDFESSANFIKYFKGLYINTDDISDTRGAIYGFNVYRSYLKVYFRNYRKLENQKDTLYTTYFSLPITDNSTRFNKPEFAQPANLFSSSDYIYLQGIHGTKATLKMPQLSTWKDSTNISINKAELTFKIAVSSIEAKKHPLPYRLELVAVDKKGKKTFLRYSTYFGSVPNGLLNAKDYTYTFHIPEFLQSLSEGKNTFDYFELSTGSIEKRNKGIYPGDAKNTAARVVLYNSGEKKPSLNVTYTKY